MLNSTNFKITIDIESKSKSFLLVNSEFAFDANVYAFELNAAKNGNVEIEIASFGNLCSQFSSCAEYFRIHPYYPDKSVLFKEKFFVSLGYNYIVMPYAVRVPKNSMIIIHTQHENQIHLDTMENYFYSDLINLNKSLIRHSFNKNYRFQFNCLIDKMFYKFETDHQLKYSSKGNKKLSVRLSNDQISEDFLGNIYISNG